MRNIDPKNIINPIINPVELDEEEGVEEEDKLLQL